MPRPTTATRQCKAILTVATGRHGSRQFPVQRVENYTMSQSLDNDADQFSIDIGNVRGDLSLCLDRDNEVDVQVFLSDKYGSLVQIFRGLADSCEMETDHVLSIAGRDLPSALAVDSDALFGKWMSIKPKPWIEFRAHQLGIPRTQIPRMSQMNRLVTDGSEKEWALWYRIARTKGMYMWSDNLGTLIIDKLNYTATPRYHFGHPLRGYSNFIKVIDVRHSSTKQGRLRKILLYGENAKKGMPIASRSIDTHIDSWRRKSLSVQVNTSAKNQQELNDDAKEQIFEGIVGTNEVEITVRDVGVLIMQNQIALLNLPEYDLRGLWFVVGVQRQGGPQGMVQVVRLRERNFALSTRVPESPTLIKPDAASRKPAAALAEYLAQNAGIKWADSFVKATNEFGVKNGWDFAVFLGALLAMCQQETGFKNERQLSRSWSGEEWVPYTKWIAKQGGGSPGFENPTRGSGDTLYREAFANEANSRGNPFGSHQAGVGPMQLTDQTYKDWADNYGFYGIAKVDELEGGRWNPDSNIRASARVLIQKLNNVRANSQEANQIWLGVAAYNGSDAYAEKVRAIYKKNYEKTIKNALGAVKSLPDKSKNTDIPIPGYGTLQFPDNTPDEARQAISWALQHLDDPYKWGGSGPLYDCSSFVTAALAKQALYLRDLLDEPKAGYHGETTYTLFRKGRFPAPSKDNLLPCDLVFFRGNPPEHVGMYLTDGLFIHDPRTGDVVKVSSLGNDYYREQYSGARRIIAWRTRAD